MADFTELLTPTDQVLSVNGNTGAITAAQIAAAVEAATDSNTFTDADHTKLNAIESGATADQTATEIKTAYESNSNTNAFTDAEQTKLSGIEASATADQTKSDIDALGIAATTAATLATARTIAGVSFDGSANISLNNNAITNGAGYIDGSTLNAANLTGTLPAIDGSNLTGLSGGLVGGGSESLFVEAENQMDSSYATTASKNYLSLSPLTIASGAVLTITAGSTMYFL